MIFHKKKFNVFILFFLLVVLFFSAGFYLSYFLLNNLTPEKILQSDFVQEKIIETMGEENADIISLLPTFLGFDVPKNYLVLFLNNTELRPGGGFIGSYATLQVTQGHLEILEMGGTESIGVDSSNPNPPQIIKDKLKVDKWYLRDSNWSPDFVESSKKTLEFYQAGNNVAAGEISAVIAVTTDVLEDLMKKTGPFVVDGIEFTAENVIEKLEYEVEYGYDDKGIKFDERKAIMKPFMLALVDHVKYDMFKNIKIYKDLFTSLLEEKNILVYSLSSDLQNILDKNDWSGRMKSFSGDYLMWVDANLAALKTDHAMLRKLNYSISKDKDENYLAKATMTYIHNGSFDWRTTRYLSYARIFVPEGADLLEVKIGDKIWQKNSEKNDFVVDKGIDNYRSWFGIYVAIEPKDTKAVSFSYLLPASITENIKNNNYNLLIQKQIGLNNASLTTELKFGTTSIVSAVPAEAEKYWYDSNYVFEIDFVKDQIFNIKF
ncbi:MAG: DUF4012 domain-containing protein [Candidatus Magasanikbacteria bacterium]